MKRALAFLLLILPTLAHAQSTPNWAYKYVPQATEWNSWWASKQNYGGDVSTSTGTANGETQAIATWLGQQPINVVQFGADPTGTNDSTVAIQAALNYASSYGPNAVVIPNGTFNYTSVTVPQGVQLIGQSRLAACLVKTAATGTGIFLNNSAELRNLCMYASVSQTAGLYVYTVANQTVVDSIFARGYFIFGQAGTVGTQSIQPRFSNISTSSAATGVGSGLIILANFSNAEVYNVSGSGTLSGTQPDFGLRLDNGDTALISNVNITRHGIGLLMDVPASDNTYGVYIVNSFFDSPGASSSSTTNAACSLTPAGSGNIYETTLTNVWCGLSAGADGLLAVSGTGVIDTLSMTNTQAEGNAGSGYHFGAGVTNVTMNGWQAHGNTLNGVYISGAATHMRIAGGNATPNGSRSANGAWGINLAGVASDYLTIADNDVTGNTTGALFNGSTGTHNVVHDNTGYNPVGQSGPTVGSSPWTYTNGAAYSTLYLTGGTVSTVKLGASTICAATPCAVTLGPNEATIVTYSATPTAILDVR